MEKIYRQRFSYFYVVLSLTFCTCLIISNLVEIKTISLSWITITGGLLIFPISYIINDCVTEVYGFQKARMMVWMGFFSSLGATLVLQLVLKLPGSAEWKSQEAMEAIYGGVPRIMLASYTAFVCGSLINAYTMSWMKRYVLRSQGEANAERHFNFWFAIRAILSTVFGEGLDSLIFFPIAFWGVLSWEMIVMLIISQTIIKTLYEILILPITIKAVHLLKKTEALTSQ